ncbi:hypothetical protein [uncultured Clostridium sp.]|uniref:hypothetical protein n=1 Tax=uncultured Clostridium sp. TaxID=59620 RepID=UPI0025E3B61A|nr:hypothetical protein [uncultured Clostridium sp.]
MKKITLTQLRGMQKKLKGDEKAIIRLVPSKMSPVGMWGLWHDMELTNKTELDKIINSFSYYNCTKETGLRVSYYIV